MNTYIAIIATLTLLATLAVLFRGDLERWVKSRKRRDFFSVTANLDLRRVPETGVSTPVELEIRTRRKCQVNWIQARLSYGLSAPYDHVASSDIRLAGFKHIARTNRGNLEPELGQRIVFPIPLEMNPEASTRFQIQVEANKPFDGEVLFEADLAGENGLFSTRVPVRTV
jgi:hypothetical protein